MKSTLIEPLEARIAPATLTIASASTTEGDSGTKMLEFTVTLDEAAPEGGVTVAYQTADGTATAGSDSTGDYTVTSGTLTFAAGETTKKIQVPILGDLVGEDDETFTLTLSNAVNATIGTAEATGTILNDAKLTVTAPQASDEGDSGESDMAFTVTLVEGFKPVTVQYQTEDGTATAGSDYVATSGSLTFAAGEVTKTVHVTKKGDTEVEADETFKFSLSDATNATITAAEATGTISNDDATVTISTPQAKLEGDSGETMMVFTVTLSDSISKQVTVQYRTVDGTATAGSDYTATTGTLTFAPGETSKTISVPILGDLVGEDDEAFTVELLDPVNATIGTEGEATGTILNDAKLTVTAPQPVTEGNEGETDMVFTVTLTEGFNKTVKVGYDVLDGLNPNGATATGTDADYSVASATGELTFEPGETTKTVTVSVKGDTRKELNETVRFQLKNPENASLATSSAVGTIVDDELYEIGPITINDVVITEGDSGYSKAIFTVTLATPVPSGQQLVVSYKTVDGTAIGVGNVRDFDGIENGTITFSGNETTKTIEVIIRGDRSYEGVAPTSGTDLSRVEQFQLQLTEAKLQNSTAPNADLRPVTFAPGSDTTGLGTIRDTDSLPTVAISDYMVLEGNTPGEKTAQFTVSLSEPAGFDVRVNYSIPSGGTAVAGEDFTVPGGQLFVIIPAGSTSATIPISIIGDTTPEPTETFTVKLGAAKIATATEQDLTITRAQATGSIVNDEVKVTFDETNPVTVVEGNNGKTEYFVKIKLTGNHTQAVTVNLFTQDGTAISSGALADFEPLTTQVVFQPGETVKEVPIKIIGDTRLEGNETFKVVLTGADADIGGASGRLEQTITIQQEADEPVPTVKLSYNPPAGGLVEGGKATFTVTLSEPSNEAIEVPYKLIDGTAKSGQTGANAHNDYARGTTLKVVIPAGQTSATFTVDTLNDALQEVPETFSVELALPESEDEENPVAPNFALDAEHKSAVVTIQDDGDLAPTIGISDAVIVEGNEGERYAEFTIYLSAPSGQVVTVLAETLSGLTGANIATGGAEGAAGADYVTKTEEITFQPGEQTATFKVKINPDTVPENDETFFVRLSAPQNTPMNATIADAMATGTIRNDEAQFQILFKDANGEYTLSTLTLNEEGADNAQQSISFIVKRTGDLSGTAEVRYLSVDGVDRMDGDTKIRGAVSSGARPDYTAVSGTVQFAANQDSSAPVTIQISKDTAYEGLEEFKLQLLDALNGTVKEGTNFGVVQITDNEAVPTITVTGGSSAESGSLVFKVKLSHVDETGTVSIQYATADDTSTGAHTATGGAVSAAKGDYVSLSSSLSFAPGETEKNISVSVRGDARDEYDETFKLVLSGKQGGSATFGVDEENEPITTLSAIGTIIDDDAEAVVTITDLVTPKSGGASGEYTFTTYSEGDNSSTNKFFLVTLTGETEKLITVKYKTVSNATSDPNSHILYAIAGEDYTEVTDGTITFDPANSTESQRTVQQIKIGIINDTIVEGDQSFEVWLTEATGGVLNNKRGVAVIADDPADDPLVTINDIRLVETNGLQTANFTVTLAAKAQRAVTINYTTADGTGKASGPFADYIATSGQITIPAGQTSHEIPVQILGDIYKEADETFKVQLAGLQQGNADIRFIGTGAGTATIENGTDSIVGVGISDVKVVEGAGTATFKVELSAALSETQSTSVTATTRSGTATEGVDFTKKSGAVTIAAGQTTADFTVSITGDSVFEATEHLFVDLSNLPAGVEGVRTTARGTIFSDDMRQVDARTVQWIDLDGDLVTLKTSKGTLNLFDTQMFDFIQSGSTVGGKALRMLDLSRGGASFQGANITITAERQLGFDGDANGVLGDGRVNVGFIKAGYFSNNDFFGVDLGTVKVDGDLGAIAVGDRFMDTPAIKKLDVFSMGLHPAQTGLVPTNTATRNTDIETSSFFLGTVGGINVRTDVSGTIRVIGAQFGDIRSLTIGGALRGNEFDASGAIQFTGTLHKAVIGEIIGGTGVNSGYIVGDTTFNTSIGKITVKGDIVGNGDVSGRITAGKIGSVSAGQLIGGSGGNSGEIVAVGKIGKVSLDGVTGGSGDSSGAVRASVLSKVTIGGDVVGGGGQASGLILADSSIVQGAKYSIGTVDVAGRIIGGSGANSGVVGSDGGIGSVTVRGKLSAGEDAQLPDIKAAVSGGEGAGSGRIHSSAGLGKLTILAQDPDGIGGEKAVALLGGTGADSGKITAGSIGKATLGGSIHGSSANTTGTINVEGAIKSMEIKGDLKGGSSRADNSVHGPAAVNTTGAIMAGGIGSLIIRGDVTAGKDFGAGLSGSGSIGSQGAIGRLEVHGDLRGHDDDPLTEGDDKNVSVKIIAFGSAKEAAIGKLYVKGDAELAEITAGVSIRQFRYNNANVFPVNADARINSVVIDGDVKGLTITAGANTGVDRIFATADDGVLSAALQINEAKVYSRIASVIIRGSVSAETEVGTTGALPYGIVAQHIGSIKLGSNIPGKLLPVQLAAGPGNDLPSGSDDTTPGKPIVVDKNFNAIELPIA